MNSSNRANKVKKLIQRDGSKCHYCKCVLNNNNITVDHVIPKSKGGSDRIENLVLSCEFCNYQRSDIDYKEFKDKKDNERKLLLEKLKIK